MTTARGGVELYTPVILALAVDLAGFPLDNTYPLRGSASSRVCGSQVEVGIALNDSGLVDRIGTRVSACAVGQASAALFAKSVRGMGPEAIARSAEQLEAWLAGTSAEPEWPGIGELAPARSFPARHAAIVLPWKAALAALSNPVHGD